MKKKLFTGDSEFCGPKWLVLNHVPNASWCHLDTFILKIYFWKGWEWGIWGWRSGVLELCTTTTGSLGTLFYLSILLGKTRRWTLGSFSVSICHLYFILFYFILQYCSGFCHTLAWISHGFTLVPHPDPPPASLPIPSLWVFPVHQPWALVSCIKTGLAIFSPWQYTCFNALLSDHPTLTFSQSPKVCSVYLCLFFCPADRVIVNIFLKSIYMC